MGELISRKNFIQKSGILLGSLSLGLAGNQLLNSCQKGPVVLDYPKDKIRLGIIGTGQRWVEQISGALKYLPNFEIIAGADIIPERLENGLKLPHPKAEAYNDYRALLDNKDVDAVVVCTPLSYHFQIAKDALSAGKHVVCEKSMTYSIDQAIELEKIVKENPGLAFRVSHEFRHDATIIKVKELLGKNILGKISHVEGKWDNYGDWKREIINPQYEELINWRLHRKYCGGLMTERLTHLVDTVNYILGMHPLKAMSSGSIAFWKDERDTFDNVQTIYEYPNNINAVYSSSLACHNDGWYIKIYGDIATVKITFGKYITATINPNPKKSGSKDKVDAVTGASIMLVRKSDLKEVKHEDETYDRINEDLYSLDAGTVFGYKHFAEMIVHKKATDISVTDGKNTAISVLLANLSNRNNTIEYWKPEYGA